MIIRKYTEKDISEMVRIWNEVVEDGEAFPQEEFLDDKTGAEFFASQTYCGVADNDGEIVGLFIFLVSLYCQYLFIITLPYNTNKYSDMSHLSYGIHSVQFQSSQILISRTSDVREHYFLPLH